MAVDRDLYSADVGEAHVPPWLCGTCGLGTLRAIDDTYRFQEGTSKLYHGEDFFEPEFVRGRFQMFAACSNALCEDVATICGTYKLYEVIEHDHRGYPQRDYARDHTVDHIFPAPRLFTLSEDLPGEVVDCLERAFALYWVDSASALNAIRSAIERAMDALGIAKTKLVRIKSGKNKGKKRRSYLSLHERIGMLPDKHAGAKDSLLASKWIGNSGSHGYSVQSGDVLDSFDIAEHALNQLFDKQSKRLEKLIRNVNKGKGPVRT